MGRLIREMETGLCHSPVIAEQMETLAGMLEGHKGKKVYSYLKKPVKVQVDAIVDELAKVLEVAECYEQWNQLRDELERYYKDVPREHLPLSQQKEFKAIKNMVIREADHLQLGVFTFEDAQMKDEVDEDQDAVLHAWSSQWEMAETYQNAKKSFRSMKTQRKKKRNRCKCWSSSGVQVSPLLRISWASAGGMALAFFRMTKKRSCGFNVARKLVMTSPSMRWASCCKVRRESTKPCPGMRKR